MQANPIELIHKFNHDAGLVDKGYDDFLESSFQVEEALEGFNPEYIIASMHPKVIAGFEGVGTKARDVARLLVGTAICLDNRPTDVDRLDKACDAVVFAIGSMTKLGLSVDQITRSLNTVMSANFQKLTMPKDSFGKLMKPDDFVGPEEALQKILDERTTDETKKDD